MNQSWKSKTVAILLLIFGIPVTVGFLIIFINAMIVIAEHGKLSSQHFGLGMGLGFFGLTLPFSIVSILGGIYALKRKKWGLVLAGAITEAIIIWFLGIPSIVLTILARDEFKAGSEVQKTDVLEIDTPISEIPQTDSRHVITQEPEAEDAKSKKLNLSILSVCLSGSAALIMTVIAILSLSMFTTGGDKTFILLPIIAGTALSPLLALAGITLGAVAIKNQRKLGITGIVLGILALAPLAMMAFYTAFPGY